MDCRETQTLLTAFHDGELPVADRARVEEHLRGCPGCAARLADLVRVDQAAGVPDPGPAYWDRFNARVMDRVEREADGPKVTVLRPKGGWMRQQLRYLIPAAAAAALVVVVVRFGGMDPAVSTTARDGLVPGQAEMPRGLSPRPPAVPTAVSERAAPDSSGERRTKTEPESDGHGWPGAGAGREAPGSKAPARATKMEESGAIARPVPPPVLAKEQLAAVTRGERDRLADRSMQAGNEEAPRDRAAAPAAMSVPSPPPLMTFRGGPAGSPPVTAEDGMPPGMPAERKKMAGAAALMAEQQGAGKAKSASSPCELAHTLAERERFREAEAAQRACLAGDLDAPSREKSLVFLAELLDRQARFADADAVIAEVDRRYPQSRSLDLYRQQRSMMQKRPAASPSTR